ncbi:Ger(x)C family spore germination protein [Paenibacillus agaridevorans]|uniref:Ger(x)C family spore germination protein n=1 Tax=Paenibacillus agaridevorans TaxID=171404 RepID=UPI001BE4E021|nr:Ger(x)C family spore germination protein [Paenibacillus agaridevorans]
MPSHSKGKGWLSACCLCMIPFLLSGCWDKLEINNWAFVQAASVDLSKDGRLRLTSQIYKPGSTEASSMSPSTGATFFNISSENATVYGASLTAGNETGRKLQWSHMETLIISEAFARDRNIGEVLDFFSRSNEPKSTLAIAIAKGDARSHLDAKPLVENNVGTQLASSIENAQMLTGMSLSVSLRELSILAKQREATFVLPYLPFTGAGTLPHTPTLALFRFPEGKLIDVVPVSKTPLLLMMMNRYRNGFVNIPCGEDKNNGQGSEAFKIGSLRSTIKPRLINDQLTVHVGVEISGSVKELVCTSIATQGDVNSFTDKIAGKLEKQLASTAAYLQEQEADVIGVGEHLHRWHNGQWKTLRQNWRERFKQAKFEINVHVRLTNTGIDAGQPFTANEP